MSDPESPAGARERPAASTDQSGPGTGPAAAPDPSTDRESRAVPAAAPGTPTGQTTPDGRPLMVTQTSGGTVVAPDVNAGKEGLVEGIVHEFADQIANPQHPLGPFHDPHSTMIAGIEEHIGYVPGWLLALCIIAVLLAMIMWFPTGSPAGGTY